MSIAKYALFGLVFLLPYASLQAAPSFSCYHIKLIVEKEICEDKMLPRLDTVLSVIYKQALIANENSEQIKKAQVAWLKERSTASGLEEPTLHQQYQARIKALLNNKELYNFFINEFLKNPDEFDRDIFNMSVLAYLEAHNLNPHCEDSLCPMESLLNASKVIPIADDKFILLMSFDEGLYYQSYNFYMLSKSNDKISIVPYRLEEPKLFDISGDNAGVMSLRGGIWIGEIDKKLHFKAHPYLYDNDDSSVWELTENGGKLVSEKKAIKDEIVSQKPNPEFMLGEWEEESNSKAEILDNIHYTAESFECKKLDDKVHCEGTVAHKGAAMPRTNVNTGSISGNVIVKQKQDPKTGLGKSFLYIKDEGSDSPNDGIYIEILGNHAISIEEAEGANLGGLNVHFYGELFKVNKRAESH